MKARPLWWHRITERWKPGPRRVGSSHTAGGKHRVQMSWEVSQRRLSLCCCATKSRTWKQASGRCRKPRSPSGPPEFLSPVYFWHRLCSEDSSLRRAPPHWLYLFTRFLLDEHTVLQIKVCASKGGGTFTPSTWWWGDLIIFNLWLLKTLT